MVIHDVRLSKSVEKAISKLPRHVARKLLDWVEDVEDRGLEEVRKVKGYHDEPLHGKRSGQRSIRLSRAYRAIYRIVGGRVECVIVEEVSKHEY